MARILCRKSAGPKRPLNASVATCIKELQAGSSAILSTHRVAIANGRITDFDNGRVTFHWRDSRHGNKQKLMTLDAVEFIRRYLSHVLPCGL